MGANAVEAWVERLLLELTARGMAELIMATEGRRTGYQ